MKKLLKRALASILLAVTLLTATACSFIAGDELQIADITHDLMDDGSTRITITYNDEEIEPLVFTIPAGQRGEKGDGIENILYTVNQDKSTTVTIKYTLLEGGLPKEDTVFTIPANAYVTGVTQKADETTGDILLTFNFSSGTDGAPIPPVTVTLTHGKDGKDGDSITNIESETVENLDGSKTVTVYVYTSGSDEPFDFSYDVPAGVSGKGIESIVVDEEKTTTNSLYIYYLVAYDNGEVQELTVPKNNVWRNGEGAPNSSTEGLIGDYYVDTKGYKIYCKEVTGEWVVVLDLSSQSTQEHWVTFVNGNSWEERKISHGLYFAATNKDIPVYSQNGYIFLGWYTMPQNSSNVNAGKFTDLTPVMSDLTVYAWWEEITE